MAFLTLMLVHCSQILLILILFPTFGRW